MSRQRSNVTKLKRRCLTPMSALRRNDQVDRRGVKRAPRPPLRRSLSRTAATHKDKNHAARQNRKNQFRRSAPQIPTGGLELRVKWVAGNGAGHRGLSFRRAAGGLFFPNVLDTRAPFRAAIRKTRRGRTGPPASRLSHRPTSGWIASFRKGACRGGFLGPRSLRLRNFSTGRLLVDGKDCSPLRAVGSRKNTNLEDRLSEFFGGLSLSCPYR